MLLEVFVTWNITLPGNLLQVSGLPVLLFV